MPTIQGADWLLDLNNADLTTDPASDAQAIAKSANDVAITPANLAAIGASAIFAGLVELATSAETITGTDTARAVTPADLAAALAVLAPLAGTHIVTAGEDIAGSADIDTGKATATAFVIQVLRDGVPVFSDQEVSMAAGVITITDTSATGGTFALTENDVVNWIAF